MDLRISDSLKERLVTLSAPTEAELELVRAVEVQVQTADTGLKAVILLKIVKAPFGLNNEKVDVIKTVTGETGAA